MPELNHHYDNRSQKYAFDFIQTDDSGRFYRTDGRTNDDYYSFGATIIAPAGGLVIEAVDGVRDNLPGEINPYAVIGNYVLLQHAAAEYSLLGHLRLGSLEVKAGDTVAVRQKLGECGNSGNSSDPHLHYQLQDRAVFARLNKQYEKLDVAEGLKVCFSDVAVMRSGKAARHKLYSPVKGDIVQNF